MGWLQDRGWVVGLIVAAALALAGLAWWTARRPAPVPGAAARRQVDLTFAAAVLVTLAVGLAAVLWLLGQADQVPPGEDRATLQTDAVKTGAAIALGTGGAAYLLLAYRRQRLDEVDTRERRITELYTKAVEQLGHEKAPVRLGALYSLERLAQNNPEHRQTVIDVYCAYLRMPYTLPPPNKPGATQGEEAAPPADDRDRAPDPVLEQGSTGDEMQVRQTAQRILAAHLKLPPPISGAAAQRRQPSARRAFWPGINLDLTGAALVEVNLEQVSVVQAQFNKATFQGSARFRGATFQGDAEFDRSGFLGSAGFREATFHGGVGFRGATFQAGAEFDKATFLGGAGFGEATFLAGAGFREATFQRGAGFDKVTFHRDAWFRETAFHGDVGFRKATFKGIAGFYQAMFQSGAEFNNAMFQSGAEFNKATFQGGAGFREAAFHGDVGFREAAVPGGAGFRGATFHGGAKFNDVTFIGGPRVKGGIAEAQVLHLQNPTLNKRRVWPDGYIVRPDPADLTRGRLIHREQAEEP
jgi:uncharacterized protein YjbI with pentapeptide repeats